MKYFLTQQYVPRVPVLQCVRRRSRDTIGVQFFIAFFVFCTSIIFSYICSAQVYTLY